jgi:carboxyl-terminal processing protease
MTISFIDDPRRKLFMRMMLGVCLTAALLFAGCEPTRDDSSPGSSAEPNAEVNSIPSPQPQAVEPVPVKEAEVPISAVAERMSAGDFAGAERVCKRLDPTSPQVAQFSNVLLRYGELEKKREQKRIKAFEEQIKEIDKQRKQAEGGIDPNHVDPAAAIGTDGQSLDVNNETGFDIEPNKPNKIDMTLAAAVRAREYADEDKKESVINDSFIQQTIAEAKQKAQEYEKDGKWIDAYVHYYYWMMLLYEEEKTYKDKAEQLTEMASIELSLKKSDCGESAIERYQDIEPFMFIRALQALDGQYVHPLEYRDLCDKAIERCHLLGRVLVGSKEELAWRTDPNELGKWETALDALRSGLDENKNKKRLQDVVQLFDDTLTLNETTLRLPREVVIAHFSEAALSALDPFTNIIWPWNVKDFEKSMTQQFSGIGVEISKVAGAIKIGSLLPDTPAYHAGLDAGDEIILVEGESTKKMTIFCAVDKITGPKGTKVKLTIRRPATGKTWDVTIVRDKIVVQPLRGWQRSADGQWDWMIDPANRIGYIRLTTFTETSGPDLDATLKKLESNGGLNGLILDLRYNPGGYLQSAAEVVDLFVREGMIVKSTPRQGFSTYEIAHAKGTHPDYPLVVLINESSASASEIVSGALQDPKHSRAILVGQRSYGKGSVQVVSGYTGGGSQMKYTVAYYHLPSDQPVKSRYQMEKLGRKDWGIAPDVEVEINTAELKEMVEMQRDNDVLVQADHDPNDMPNKHSSLAQTLDSDPQLAIGLLVVQSKLIETGKELQLPADPNTIVLKR